ncbi:uncharacterized protein LOC143603035 [Bidens hawaiensis]|uniref:uncharacterized protein LOC143603035 n=1 Tax=Bidens hawaiensis TaxID=980011 RepID=UPI0040490CB6
MSHTHTLPDLATCLPPDFLTGELAYSSSNESESDDDDVTGLPRRFTRSVSLQDRFKTPYPPLKTKRGLAGSPESTFNWNVSGPTQAWSTPTTPFGHRKEDSWDLIYAAAEQVAMMKFKMKMNHMNDVVFGNRGLIGAPRPLGPPVSHYLPHTQRVSGGPLGFRQSAWLPLPVETQRRQQTVGFNNVVKKERAGTGVFLPRNYLNIPPEFNKKPAGVDRSFNKNMDPIIAPPQPNIILAGFVPPPPPRRSTGRETQEIVLPQEWTY